MLEILKETVTVTVSGFTMMPVGLIVVTFLASAWKSWHLVCGDFNVRSILLAT